MGRECAASKLAVFSLSVAILLIGTGVEYLMALAALILVLFSCISDVNYDTYTATELALRESEEDNEHDDDSSPGGPAGGPAGGPGGGSDRGGEYDPWTCD